MRALILLAGLLLVAWCVVVVIKPSWFGNVTVTGRDRTGVFRRRMRLAEAPIRSVRLRFVLLAASIVVLTLFVYVRVDARLDCRRARAVYEAGRTEVAWQAAAAEAGLHVRVVATRTSGCMRWWTATT